MATTAGSLAKKLAAQYGHQECDVLAWLDATAEDEIGVEDEVLARAAYAADYHRISEEQALDVLTASQSGRDTAIRDARATGVSAISLAARTGLSIQRIYQILAIR